MFVISSIFGKLGVGEPEGVAEGEGEYEEEGDAVGVTVVAPPLYFILLLFKVRLFFLNIYIIITFF